MAGSTGIYVGLAKNSEKKRTNLRLCVRVLYIVPPINY